MKLRTLLTIAFFYLLSKQLTAAIIYVTEAGAGSMNGTSWTNAYPGTSLQLAINLANSGDQVWVAGGTYFTTTGTDRNIAFSLKNNVDVYGSFAGTETLLSERNITCGPNSYLSGYIGTAANTDNSYKVMRNTTGIDSTTMLNGFVISGAYDERTATLTVGLGGGILNVGSGPGNYCNPTFMNCIIRDNEAEFGAGIFNDAYNGGQAMPVIVNCIIENNHATGGGGGIDNFGLLNGQAFPTIINTVIANNTADDAAGAMYCWGGSNGIAGAGMYNVTIANNTVTSGNGGGFVIDNSNSGAGGGGTSGLANVSLINCILWGNTANIGPQFRIYGTGTIDVQYSDVDTNNQNGINSITSTTSSIFINPLFLNPSTPIGSDNCWMTSDDGYSLQTLSPCINTGLISTSTPLDLAFNNRFYGPSVDMGAYENHYSTIGINQNDEIEFTFYPNPVINELYIQSHQTQKMVLLNGLGQEIKRFELNEGKNMFSLQGLSPGIYYLMNEKGSSKKVIKY